MQQIDAKTLYDWISDGQELAILDAREDGEFGAGHLFWAVPFGMAHRETRAHTLLPRKSVRICVTDDGGRLAADLARMAGGQRLHRRRRARRRHQGLESRRLRDLQRHERALQGVRRVGRAPLRHRKRRSARAEAMDRQRPQDDRARQPHAGGIHPDVDPHRHPDAGRGAGVSHRRPRARSGHAGGGQLRRPHAQHHGRREPPPRRHSQQGCGAAQRHDGMGTGRSAMRTRPPGAFRPRHAAHRRAGVATGHGLRRGVGRAGNFPGPTRGVRGRQERARCMCWTPATRANIAPAIAKAATARPGGQLVQGTDNWVAVRGARIVVVDDTGVRARMSAAWLRQMGNKDVFVADNALGSGNRQRAARPRARRRRRSAPRRWRNESRAPRSSTSRAASTSAPAISSTRSGACAAGWRPVVAKLASARRIVLTSPDGAHGPLRPCRGQGHDQGRGRGAGRRHCRLARGRPSGGGRPRPIRRTTPASTFICGPTTGIQVSRRR